MLYEGVACNLSQCVLATCSRRNCLPWRILTNSSTGFSIVPTGLLRSARHSAAAIELLSQGSSLHAGVHYESASHVSATCDPALAFTLNGHYYQCTVVCYKESVPAAALLQFELLCA
jgi:hypothetical protein